MLLCIAVTVHQLYVFISGTWRVVSIAAASVALSNMEIGFFFSSCISQIRKVKCMEIGESTYWRNVIFKTCLFFPKFWNFNRKKQSLHFIPASLIFIYGLINVYGSYFWFWLTEQELSVSIFWYQLWSDNSFTIGQKWIIIKASCTETGFLHCIHFCTKSTWDTLQIRTTTYEKSAIYSIIFFLSNSPNYEERIAIVMCTGLKNEAACSKVYILLNRTMIEISSKQKQVWKLLQS